MNEDRKDLYRSYARSLQARYGCKVYRLPIHLPVSCPNRSRHQGGCSFCAPEGAGHEFDPKNQSIAQQIAQNREKLQARYKPKAWIAYFQNYTNTYLKAQELYEYARQAAVPGVVALSVSTRPDCVGEDHLEALAAIRRQYGIDITIELGLQSVSAYTLQKIRRGHGLAEYLEAAARIRRQKFDLTTHMILNLPYDRWEDVLEGARVLSVTGATGVKMHSLYLPTDTPLAQAYLKGEVRMIAKEEYIRRCAYFLAHLSPHIVVERLMARAPQDSVVFSNYATSWWKLRDEVFAYMDAHHLFQGILAPKGGYAPADATADFLERE